MNSLFQQKFGNRKVGFLIRKFQDRDDRNTLINNIKQTFKENSLKLIDATEYTFHDELWRNIKEYMDNCDFGVVVIDNFTPDDDNQFNPNVFLEIGYLLAISKPILILIQNSLTRKIPTDMRPFIYETFDALDINSDKLKNIINKWIQNFNSIPGYINVYFKKDHVSIDLLSNFKDILYSMSDCEIVESSNKTLAVSEEDLNSLKIDYHNGVLRTQFKTCTLEMAKRFESDFTNNVYKYVKPIIDSILKIEVSQFPSNSKESVSDPGITYLLNSDKEFILSCSRDYIENCIKEIDYGKQFLKIKETQKLKELEIVMIKKFDSNSSYLYISNYKTSPKYSPLKMYHGRKKDNLPCLPLSTADILFMMLFGEVPTLEKIQKSDSFRKSYLEAIDLHIDKVRYVIQNGVPTDNGLAKNIEEIEKNKTPYNKL